MCRRLVPPQATFLPPAWRTCRAPIRVGPFFSSPRDGASGRRENARFGKPTRPPTLGTGIAFTSIVNRITGFPSTTKSSMITGRPGRMSRWSGLKCVESDPRDDLLRNKSYYLGLIVGRLRRRRRRAARAARSTPTSNPPIVFPWQVHFAYSGSTKRHCW